MLSTENALLDWLDELDGLIRDGLALLGGIEGLDCDGLTPLELQEDITEVLLGDGSRDPRFDKD